MMTIEGERDKNREKETKHNSDVYSSENPWYQQRLYVVSLDAAQIALK